MKIMIGQTNTTPGDFEGNCQQIIEGIQHAQREKCHIAIFPELSIPGYLIRDMMYQEEFVDKNLQFLDIIKQNTLGSDLLVVVGYIDANHTGTGKPFRNRLGAIRNGLLLGTYTKWLYPFYDVFDEGRYFEPGNELLILKHAGEKIGFTICEDIWNDKGQDDWNYAKNPIAEYAKRNISYLVNISSSPFVVGKPIKKLSMLKSVASENRFNIIYVNQVGGQDDLVFDGLSSIISNTGVIHSVIPTYNRYVAVNDQEKPVHVSTPYESISSINDILVLGLRDYVHKSGFKDVVLGSSGGIDSAVVAALACKALGNGHVTCIMMPGPYSSKDSITDAKELHKNLGCRELLIPIGKNSIKKKFCNVYSWMNDLDLNPVADENEQARERGQIIMWFSNALNYLALTTGNKTELATGYCTLYGDMNGGFAPINDLYKMQVYDLARYQNIIPKNILNKDPSAELAPGQTDEHSLGMKYVVLDRIVQAFIEDYICTFDGFCKWCLENKLDRGPIYDFVHNLTAINTTDNNSKYLRIINMINRNEFKRRQAAPGIKLSKVAFGSGRRLPIVKR